MSSSQPDLSHESPAFEERWNRLGHHADIIFHRGFDTGRALFEARHEIRGLDVLEREHGKALVVAGDKLGRWHAASVDIATAKPEWAKEIPKLLASSSVIDQVRFVHWHNRPAVVLGTRRNGAWIVPVSHILDPQWDQKKGILELPGSKDREIQRLLWDEKTHTLWCATGQKLLSWSLGQEQPVLRTKENLGCRVTALTIDLGSSDTTLDDHLYITTNRLTLHRVQRDSHGAFEVSRQTLVKPPLWRGRLSVIDHLCPLSSVRRRDEAGQWHRAYPHRGVVATTLRHLMLIHDNATGAENPTTGSNVEPYCQSRLVVARSKILSLTVLNLPDWQGVAVSTLEGNLRIYRPSGVRAPHRRHDHYLESAPEIEAPGTLISGYDEVPNIGRIYNARCLPPVPDPQNGASAEFLPIVFALGDNEVRLNHFRARWALRRQSQRQAAALVADLPTADFPDIDALTLKLQGYALHHWSVRSVKNTLTCLLPEVGIHCKSDQSWQNFLLLVWDVLSNCRELRSIPIYTIQALRKLQSNLEDSDISRHQSLEETIFQIRKYVLDQVSFSDKKTQFLTLQSSKDPGLSDDRMIYRSILIARRTDPIFITDLSHQGFSEVQAFAQLPWHQDEHNTSHRPSPGPRFLGATYGGHLWMLDHEGGATHISGNNRNLGQIRAFHFRHDDVIVSFEDEPLRVLDRQALIDIQYDPSARNDAKPDKVTLSPLKATQDKSKTVTAFCDLPGHQPGKNNDFIYADRSGRVHLCSTGQVRQLLNLKRNIGTRRGAKHSDVIIHHLAALSTIEADGKKADYLVAATNTSELFVYRWSEDSRSDLQHLCTARVGFQPLTSLLVIGGRHHRIVVGTTDGRVVGCRLVSDQSNHSSDNRLALIWAFQAGATVRCIQRLDPSQPLDDDTLRSQLILVGSHDQNLYVLDIDGRHIEIFQLRDFKADLFVTTPNISTQEAKVSDDDQHAVEALVYLCAFENRYSGLRLINRRKLIDQSNEKLSKLPQREMALTRWRAYSIKEGHLRHRFIRQSNRYPGEGPEEPIQAIRVLMQAHDEGPLPTGEVTALLRRMFQTRIPGSSKDSPRRGLYSLLQSAELYGDAIQLLRELEERWDTPGSLHNQRVRLFWIRSFLRNIEDTSMLRQWYKVGRDPQHGDPLPTPGWALQHFFNDPAPLVQFKSLQYLERLLFGWPDVTRIGLLKMVSRKEARQEIDEFLDAVLLRIQKTPEGTEHHQLDSVILQCCRILSLLVKHGHLDPLFLAYRIEQLEIPHGFYQILIGQLSSLGDCEPTISNPSSDPKETNTLLARARGAARVLKCSASMLRQTKTERTFVRRHTIAALETLIEHCQTARNESPDATYCQETRHYFSALIPLLQVSNLDGLRNLTSTWMPTQADTVHYYPSHTQLDMLRSFLDTARHYWEQKHKDIVAPFTELQFENFDKMRRTWRGMRTQLENPNYFNSQQESHLIHQLANSWERIVDEEQSIHLLKDFTFAIKEHYAPVPELGPGSQQLVEIRKTEEKRAHDAFTNLYIRLILFAEPDEGLFLFNHSVERSNEVVGLWLRPGHHDAPTLVEIGQDISPRWMSPDWLKATKFANLGETICLDYLRETEGDTTWRAIPISVNAEQGAIFGLYIFGWHRAESTGLIQFDRHLLAWSMPLEAMVYRRAAIEQETLKGDLFSIIAHNLRGPIHHLRSDLRLLEEGFLEDQEKDKRIDKYRQLLGAARKLDGIVQSVLSIQARRIQVELTTFSLANLLHDLVRTARKEASDRNIEITFPRPTPEDEKMTMVESDEAKVYDIVSNLLSNAIKYSPPGTRITVNSDITTHGVEIRVQDEGVGIPDHEISNIFDLYYRGSVPRAKGISGLGMGLYATRLYANLLGGRIKAEKHVEGEGTTFIVYLPGVVRADSSR